MDEQFDKVLDLAQKLKGPMVVYDKNGGKHLVILGIDEFAQYFDSSKITATAPVASPNTKPVQEPVVEVEKTAAEPEVRAEEVAEVVVEEVLVRPTQGVPQVKSPDWHRLGDVMRRVRPEIAPEGAKPVPYQAHEEPIVEGGEADFLEEPAP